jgi:putative transposase
MEVTKHKEEQGNGKEAKKVGIDPVLLDQLIEQYERPEEAAGAGGLLEQLTKRVYERILSGEMTHYLGYAKGEAPKLEEGQFEDHYFGSIPERVLALRGVFENAANRIGLTPYQI